jgi:small basic protein
MKNLLEMILTSTIDPRSIQAAIRRALVTALDAVAQRLRALLQQEQHSRLPVSKEE